MQVMTCKILQFLCLENTKSNLLVQYEHAWIYHEFTVIAKFYMGPWQLTSFTIICKTYLEVKKISVIKGNSICLS